MKNRRNDSARISESEITAAGEFDYQSPEKFVLTDDMAWSEDEVRKICDEVRDHL